MYNILDFSRLSVHFSRLKTVSQATAGRARTPAKAYLKLSWARPAFEAGGLRSLTAAVAILLALGGCASKELPPADNAFCVLYQPLPDPSDAIHMKKRENKLAVLANEQTHNECKLGDRSNSGGPR